MNKLFKLPLVIMSISMIFITNINAQYDERDNHPYDFGPGVPPGGDDPDPAPINDYIPILIILGLTLAYFGVRGKSKEINKE